MGDEYDVTFINRLILALVVNLLLIAIFFNILDIFNSPLAITFHLVPLFSSLILDRIVLHHASKAHFRERFREGLYIM